MESLAVKSGKARLGSSHLATGPEMNGASLNPTCLKVHLKPSREQGPGSEKSFWGGEAANVALTSERPVWIVPTKFQLLSVV